MPFLGDLSICGHELVGVRLGESKLSRPTCWLGEGDTLSGMSHPPKSPLAAFTNCRRRRHDAEPVAETVRKTGVEGFGVYGIVSVRPGPSRPFLPALFDQTN
jgi:hypothetical protein